MNVDIILILVFFLSLLFLAMIFGERLSLFGFVDGRWLTAPFDMLGRFWGMVCEATDRLWCFVFDHFWWVTATASGGIGVLLVALIMVSGLTKEAAAVRLEERVIMPVGSVLDHTTVLDSDNVVLMNAVASQDDVSQLIYQVPSGIRRSKSFPVVRERPRFEYVPPLPREPTYSRSRLTLTMEPLEREEGVVEKIGRPDRSQNFDRLIDRALTNLRNDIPWRISSQNRAAQRIADSRRPMAEDSQFAVGDLTSRVRVVPGDVVSMSNLRVEKYAPSNPGRGDFEIQIRLTNLSRERVNGVVVREMLPVDWIAKNMTPRGVFRDSTATWLVNDLGPLQDQILTLQVQSTQNGPFDSLTEVSATAAVTSTTRVARRTRSLPPVTPLPREDERLPLPRLRLILEDEPEAVDVGQWTTANFRVENIGEVPAVGVSLLVNLPARLDHHALDDNDIKRQVDWKVRRIEPGDFRRMPLVVKPTFRGRHFATAELSLRGQQLTIKPFDIVGLEAPVRERPLEPIPDAR